MLGTVPFAATVISGVAVAFGEGIPSLVVCGTVYAYPGLGQPAHGADAISTFCRSKPRAPVFSLVAAETLLRHTTMSDPSSSGEVGSPFDGRNEVV
ncbi:MAG: hypothetical protein ACREBT_06470 [Thermoplasmata archaeon]